MKKTLLADGAGVLRFCAVLATLGILFFLAPSSFAQTTTYTAQFFGLPSGSVDLTQYIGLDRKLKPNVSGQYLHITVTPPLTQPKLVVVEIVVSASSTTIECNGEIARVTTKPFLLTGAGMDLGASAFTSASTIGIGSSSQSQPCIDALADKMSSGVASIPAGTYTIKATVKEPGSSTRVLNPGDPFQPAIIQVSGASVNEAVLNLTSPMQGELVPATGNVVFQFENSIPGRLLVFEHSSFMQSPDDATRNLNSSLKTLDFSVSTIGSNQISAPYPGVAVRNWTAGKKYSWLFLGSLPGSSDVRRSPVWSFTVTSNDPMLSQLTTTLATAPDPIGSTFSNLINSGYTLAFSASNPILLQEGDNGIPHSIDISQVVAWLADIARRNVHINAVITQ